MKSTWFRYALAVGLLLPALHANAENSVSIGEDVFTNRGIVAAARIPSNQRDKFGETFGSSSGMALVADGWRRSGNGYEGTFLLVPDRGYNAAGTTDYRPRVNTVTVKLTPGAGPAAGSLAMTLADSVILTDADGQVLSGLDPDQVRKASAGFPDLPQAGNGKIVLDAEAIVSLPDGGYFISDEYGPYIYRFNAAGRLVAAIRPPEAFIPIRKGTQHFGSNNPGTGAAAPEPPNPEFGRQNNQGFEGMALSPDGRVLSVILQSANRQDGGDAAATRRHTRLLTYDVSDLAAPKLSGEYVVPLPVFKDAKGAQLVAAQSELVALGGTRYLLLSRDSANGYGMKGVTSLYRKVGIVDLAGATNIAGSDYDKAKAVAPKGVLDDAVKPAALVDFIDINDNAELAKVGFHNGEPNDRANLSEKWESMALVSVMDPAAPNDYFLFVGNDNDFLTQDGFQVGAPYKDESGADVDTTFLVYRVTLPGKK